LLSIKGLDSS